MGQILSKDTAGPRVGPGWLLSCIVYGINTVINVNVLVATCATKQDPSMYIILVFHQMIPVQ